MERGPAHRPSFALRGLAALTMSIASAVAPAAEPETASLDISAIVPAACSVDNLVLNLGTTATLEERQRTTTGAIEVTCPIGAAYSISLADEGPRLLQPMDGTSKAQPISFTALLIGSDLATSAATLNRIGTGVPDRVAIQIKSVLSGNELAGSYRQQLTLTVDW